MTFDTDTDTDVDDRPAAEDASASPDALWPGDLGTLSGPSRRALVQLLRGPYLSFRRHAQLWSALLRDERAVRGRLHELFLDLVVDLNAEVAFVRNVSVPDDDVPKTVRSASLTFLDTGMLLVLRQHLLNSDGVERVIIGRDDVDDQLESYRDAATVDPAAFAKRLNASWLNMKKYGIIVDAETDDRVEISPVLRLVFGPDEIAAVRDEYRRIAQEARP